MSKETNEKLRKIFQKKQENRKRNKKYTPKPRYDEVFYEGLEWLNSLRR